MRASALSVIELACMATPTAPDSEQLTTQGAVVLFQVFVHQLVNAPVLVQP